MKKSPDCFEKIMAGLEGYLNSQKVKDGIICHATTWLNQERWLDEMVDFERQKNQPKDDYYLTDAQMAEIWAFEDKLAEEGQ